MNAYAIRRRNERMNGKKNQESLEFMEYVKLAPIDRELGRREKR